MPPQIDVPQDHLTDFDQGVDLCPTPDAPDVLARLPARPAGSAPIGRHVGVAKHAILQVAVLDVARLLGDATEDLDEAIQVALAEGPRAVVCDLTALSYGVDPGALEVLATAGRHVRDWPGIPVAIACPDRQVREALAAHALGRYLNVTESLSCALSAVSSAPDMAVERIRLCPHPTAPRASREFVTRTLLDWRLGRSIHFTSLVASVLVASSSIHAGTDIDVSVVWDREGLRLSVRDYRPARSSHRSCDLRLHGRLLTVLAGLSRSFGVLPTADGGKVVWAVFDASQLRPGTSDKARGYAERPATSTDIVTAI